MGIEYKRVNSRMVPFGLILAKNSLERFLKTESKKSSPSPRKRVSLAGGMVAMNANSIALNSIALARVLNYWLVLFLWQTGKMAAARCALALSPGVLVHERRNTASASGPAPMRVRCRASEFQVSNPNNT